MADAKDPDVIELVAVERGFVGTRLVEPGQTFQFRRLDADGKERRLPKWAAKPGSAPAKVKKAVNADTRPREVQDAVKKKAGDLAGGATGLV